MNRRVLMSVVSGLGVTFGTWSWARAHNGYDEPDRRNIAANVRPALFGAERSNLMPFARGNGSDDAQGIREAIDRFKVLFEGKDADRLKQGIWPSMNDKQYRAIKATFQAVSQVTLREECQGSPTVTGDSAEWACNEVLAYYSSGKPQPGQSHPIVFHLKKRDGTWYVESRTAN